jgi:serine/threonine protein kinase
LVVAGWGEVWKARDTRLDRIVAVKRLLGHKGRFEREARAIAALNHPHICQIYDAGSDFLVLEFVQGDTLANGSTAGSSSRRRGSMNSCGWSYRLRARSRRRIAIGFCTVI